VLSLIPAVLPAMPAICPILGARLRRQLVEDVYNICTGFDSWTADPAGVLVRRYMQVIRVGE